MNKVEFEKVLDKCCRILTDEALKKKFSSSSEFENKVRQTLDILTSSDDSFE